MSRWLTLLKKGVFLFCFVFVRKENITLGAAKLPLEKLMLSLGSKVHHAWKKMQPPLRELQECCIPMGIQGGYEMGAFWEEFVDVRALVYKAYEEHNAVGGKE